MRLASTRLWPFNRVLAFIWMVLVWCAYLLFLASAAQYPGRNLALTGSTGLLGVLAVSLIPLALSVIDLLAHQRGTLEFRGMKLDFAQGAAPSATATVAPNLGLPENLGLPGGDAGSRVLGSGPQEIIQGLEDSARRRVACLDLGDGSSWMSSRKSRWSSIRQLLEATGEWIGLVRKGRYESLLARVGRGGERGA